MMKGIAGFKWEYDFESIVEDKKVTEKKSIVFVCDVETQIPQAKEACFQFLKYLGQVEDKAKQDAETVKAAETKPEEPKPVEPIEG